jgi:cell division protein YceG involved in septum cleavage
MPFVQEQTRLALRTLYEVIVLASIVEREAVLPTSVDHRQRLPESVAVG